MPVRVHLASPDPPASAIAAVIANAGAEISGRSETLDDLLREGADSDIVALSAMTPGSLGVAQAVYALRSRRPEVRVILLLSAEDPLLIGEAMKAGVYDWTVGDALARELPSLIHRPRTFADVAKGGPDPAPPSREDFGPGAVHVLGLGFGPRQSETIERFLLARYPGRVRVTVREETFEALLQAVNPETSGILLSASLPGAFDLAVRLRLLQGVARSAKVAVLYDAQDMPEAGVMIEAAGFLAVRGERGEGGVASFRPDFADPLLRRLDLAARIPPVVTPVPAPVASERRRPAPPAREEARTEVVAVPSRLIAVVSPTTGVGKTAAAVNIATFAGRLGIQTLLIDQTVLPPGNAALRLGFDLKDPGLELLLQGPWDEATFQRLRLRYEKTALYLLRPISDQVVGTLSDVREGAYDDLMAQAKRQYPLVVVDTSPILDDLSVLSALRTAERVVIVLETTDDRVQQAIARVPWILKSMPDASRALYVVNKVGPGGWSPDEIMAALGMPDVRALPLPSEPVRHARAARAYRPVAMDAGPRDPWARLFVEVAGDIVPPDRRRRWRVEQEIRDDTTRPSLWAWLTRTGG